MRFEGTEPEGCAGNEGVRFVQSEKDGEPEKKKDGSLAEVDAEERGGKAVAEPGEMAAGGAEELPKDADRSDEEAEHRKRPGKRGDGGREVAEGVGQGQRPGSVAHVVGAGAAETGVAFDAADGGGVIGIAMLDELMAGGPVDDEVAAGNGGGICGKGAEKKSGVEGGEDAGDGNEECGEFALAGHRGTRLSSLDLLQVMAIIGGVRVESAREAEGGRGGRT